MLVIKANQKEFLGFLICKITGHLHNDDISPYYYKNPSGFCFSLWKLGLLLFEPENTNLKNERKYDKDFFVVEVK